MNLDQLKAEMRLNADSHPFRPLRDDIHRYQRVIDLGTVIFVTYTRTVLPSGRHIYQFSMSNKEGNPTTIPDEIVQRLRKVFVPRGFSIPSTLGNCYQWLEEI